MDTSNNIISNDVNDENNDLPDLIPIDASRIIPFLPTSRLLTPMFNSGALSASSIFSLNNNHTSQNNIVYQPSPLYGTTINSITQQSFQEQGAIYKRIISEKGKQDIVFSKFDSDTEQICAITRCPFEKGEEIATLPCNHVFNKDAIMSWLEKKSSECPVCRYTLDEKEVRKEMPTALATSPVSRAAGSTSRQRLLRNMLYDILDRRLQEDEEERVQRALLLSLRENTSGGDGTDLD